MATIPFLGFSDPISSWTHLLAAVITFVGSFFLIKKGRGNTSRVIALSVFSFTLVFLFSMSGVFHMLNHESVARQVLRRLDNAAIWTMIAGTFTPLHVILFRGPWRWAMLTFIWAFAITGLVLHVVFFDSLPEALIVSLFLGLGWMGAFSGYQFHKLYHDKSLWMLIGGAIAYSIGAIIDFTRWPVVIPGVLGSHEIFHIFVILGCLFHWMLIYKWAHHPISNTVIFYVRIFPERPFIAEAVDEHLYAEASTLEELKILLRKNVRAKYHNTIQPLILLKYFNEEYI